MQFLSSYLILVFTDARANSLDLIVTPVLCAILIWLSVTDWKTFRLPDAGTLPLIGFGLALTGWRIGGFPLDAALGAGIGFALFAAIGSVYFRSRGIDALGLGDAKLLSAAGAWLGWQALPTVVLMASLAGIALALATRHTKGNHIAFGPMLALAFMVHWSVFLWMGLSLEG